MPAVQAEARRESEADVEELERIEESLAAAERLFGVADAASPPAALAAYQPALLSTANGGGEITARLVAGLSSLEAVTQRLQDVAGEMRASDHRIIFKAFELVQDLEREGRRLSSLATDRTMDEKLAAALVREARLEGELERQRQAFVSSTSWRLAAPLRAVGRLLHRFGRRRA